MQELMARGFIVRPYQQGDEKDIVELLDSVFNGWPHFDLRCTPLEHWKWKYIDNPLRKNVIVVCESNDKIIGCAHFLIKKIKIGNKVFLSSIGVDVAVDPNFRGIGITNKMSILEEELFTKVGIRFSYSVSGNPILIKRNIRRCYPKFPRNVMIFIRINDIDLHLKMMLYEHSWIIKYGFKIINKYNRFKNEIKSPHKLDHVFSISNIDSFNEDINELWDQVSNYHNFIVEGTREYLNWRYCDPRGGNYIVRQVDEDGLILGYSVLRINKYMKEYPIGYIVDFLTLNNRLDVADALVEDAVKYFRENGINFIQCLSINNHHYNKILNNYNFLNSRKKLNIFFQFYKQIEENLKQVKTSSQNNLHFVYGYYDWI